MPVLLLSRPTPLTPAEARALPKGCSPSARGDGVIARADVDLELPELLALAVAMGRAVPDATFFLELPQAAEAPKELAPSENVTEHDPWKLVAAGHLKDAERVFANGVALDAEGRDRCRALLASADPEQVAFGCRIARLTQWRSHAMNIKRLLTHAHPSVRRDAVAAVGVLGGPSLSLAVKPLLTDPDAEVREAAKVAFAKIG